MEKVVYDTNWEKLIRVGYELTCNQCNTRKETKSVFEFHRQSLDDFLTDVKDNYGQLSHARHLDECSPDPYCEVCLSESPMVLTRFNYIEPLTRNKRILLH